MSSTAFWLWQKYFLLPQFDDLTTSKKIKLDQGNPNILQLFPALLFLERWAGNSHTPHQDKAYLFDIY